MTKNTTSRTAHRSIEIDGLNIFYREAGPKDAQIGRASCRERV